MPHYTVAPAAAQRLQPREWDANLSSQSRDDITPVGASSNEELSLSRLHRQLSTRSARHEHDYPESHSRFQQFLNQQVDELPWWDPLHRGVCFQSLTTFGRRSEHQTTKTLIDALWRTITLQDLYEWTLKRFIAPERDHGASPLISDFCGVVRNGEMMLVLGVPGSGCSTFLRTIANDHSSFAGVTGSISYSGFSPEEILQGHRGEVAYVPEDDIHFPTLSVRQTLDFALRCKSPKRYHYQIPDYVDMLGKVFGMDHVMDTLVGNEYIRGISGGERKRVSIMESFAVDAAVGAWDNSTRGLDAASAVKYAQSLRIMTDVTGKATIVTLYQASEAVFDLMDKVLLIHEGKMIYQGPAALAKRYFEDLGFECRQGQTTADFLTSITSSSSRNFRQGWEHRAPKTATQLEIAFRESSIYRDVLQEISVFNEEDASLGKTNEQSNDQKNTKTDPFKATDSTKKSRFVSSSSSFNTTFFQQTQLCLAREWWQLKQYLWPYYVRVLSILVNAFLVGSMFYNQPLNTDGIYSRGGFMFYSVLLIGWIQLAELEGAMEGRVIIGRHKKGAVVRPSSTGFAKVVIDLFVILIEVLLYAVVAYFLSGLRREVGPFFTFVLFVYVVSVCFTQIYRLFAAFSPSSELALRYCGASLLVSVLFGGYLYPINRLLDRVPWVGWLAYVTPVLYGFEGIMATEFNGQTFNCLPSSYVPRGPEYSGSSFQTCGYAGARQGDLFVSGANYLTTNFGLTYNNIWRDLGILIGMITAYVLITLVILEKIDWSGIAGTTGIEYSSTHSHNRTSATDEENHSSEQADTAEVKVEDSEKQPHKVETTRSVFTWRHLNYRIPYGKEEKALLQNVSGYCKPGEMTALVGVSGAGKSTLLTVLSQRQATGVVSGDLKVDGKPPSASFAREIGFCEQNDIHDDTSTVREAFTFSTMLRQESHIPESQKIAYVDTVLQTLGLEGMQDAIMGTLSIEAKRRTTIGVELCAKPKLLLFLDEPTSGLDGQGAMSIVKLLRKLADAGQAILCTIHQASQQHFEQFHRVLALNRGGTIFYNGPVGPSGRSVFEYFKKHGCSAEAGKNVADFIIEVGTGVLASTEQPDMNWSDVWANSAEAQEVLNEIERIHSETSADDPQIEAKGKTAQFSASTWLQAKLLTKRVSRQYWRSPEYPYARLYASFVQALLNSLTFLQLGNTRFDLQSMAYAVFMVLMLVPEFINGISLRFIANRNLWLEKELPNRTYGWIAFSTAQVVSELPYVFTGAVVYYLLLYFTVGLPLGTPAGYVFLMMLFFHMFATSWGQWIAAMSHDATVAATLMPFFVIMCELFNGILRPPEQMPAFWRYTAYYVTPFTYWIGGTLSVVLNDRPVHCSSDELVRFPLPDNATTCGEYAAAFLRSAPGYLENPEQRNSLCKYCEYSTGDDFLSSYGLSGSVVWRNFGIFLGFVVSNYALVYVLTYLNSPQRKRFGRKGKPSD